MDSLRDLKRELSYQLDEQKRRSQYEMEKTEQQFYNALDQKQTQLDMVEAGRSLGSTLRGNHFSKFKYKMGIRKAFLKKFKVLGITFQNK